VLLSSSSAGQDQGDFGLTEGEAALHHVLYEVLCQLWSVPLAESLERSGFNEIQDFLLMNQAERDTLTFLDANDVVTPLPHDKKEMLLNLKLFSCYCEENGKPIMDWTNISKAHFEQFWSSITCYRAIEKVAIPLSSKFNHSRPDNATMPRNVTSSTMVTSNPMLSLSSSPSAAIPRASSSALATATPVSKHVLFSESQDVEDC